MKHKQLTQSEVDSVWGNADFGPSMSRMDVVKYGLLKCAGRWYQGHTSTCILRELGLITKPSPGQDYDQTYQDTNVAGDRMSRGTSFTPPRTLTLDTKYEGAVIINVWPGYAVQVVSKTGEREVVVGPKSVILEYDQVLEVLSLSTGKPKTDHDLLQTVYLQVKNNRVSDIVEATTKDMVDIKARVNYRLHFEGKPENWFSVDNYVKFLTQNLRSMIRNEIKKHTIQDVSDNIASIIRDLILGTPVENKGRPGRAFEENGMHVVDVEILGMDIGDERIKSQILAAQYSAVESTMAVIKSTQTLTATQTLEQNKVAEITAKSATAKAAAEAEKERIEQAQANEMATAEKNLELAKKNDETEQVRHDRRQKGIDQELAQLKEEVKVRTEEFEKHLKAIQPDLIAAMQSMSEKDLAKTLAEHLPSAGGGLGLVLGASLMENLKIMTRGTPMEKVFTPLAAPAQEKSN